MSNTIIVVGFGPPVGFPEVQGPRVADDPYDSLSNDPTYVPDPVGPSPQKRQKIWHNIVGMCCSFGDNALRS